MCIRDRVKKYEYLSESEHSVLWGNLRLLVTPGMNRGNLAENFVHDATQAQAWLEQYVPELSEHPLWSIVTFEGHPSVPQTYNSWQGVWAK
eukprot:3465448-Rhodomonas_salina.1